MWMGGVPYVRLPEVLVQRVADGLAVEDSTDPCPAKAYGTGTVIGDGGGASSTILWSTAVSVFAEA